MEADDHCVASSNDIKEVVWGQRFTIKTPSAFGNALKRFGQTFGDGVYGTPIGNTQPPAPSSRGDDGSIDALQ